MNAQLERLRADVQAKHDEIMHELATQQARLFAMRDVLNSIDSVAASEPAIETLPEEQPRPERAERRDVQGTVLNVLAGGRRLAIAAVAEHVAASIGPVTESAIARSLVGLVREGKVEELGGEFAVPTAERETWTVTTPEIQEAAK